MNRGRKAITTQVDRPQCICGNLCAVNYKSKLGFTLYKSACKTCIRFPYRKKKKPHCERCGFIPVHKAQLDVHHKDRDNKNNQEFNLETLCANCHRLEHADEFIHQDSGIV